MKEKKMAILNLEAQESDIKSLSSALLCYNKIQSKCGQVLWGTTCVKLMMNLLSVPSQASWTHDMVCVSFKDRPM